MMPTAQQIRELLSYDSSTGVFTRSVRTSNRIKAGSMAGSKDRKGYLCIRVLGRTHKAHRLAWIYVHGVWPAGEIDHINGDKADNRINNLRDVSKSTNQQNRRTVRGYSRDGLRWKAQIVANGSKFHLGCFGTEREAHDAYVRAKPEMHQIARQS
jgi:hypothetical protein